MPDREGSNHFAPEILGPSFDTLGGEVQQPGTLRRGAPEGHMELHHDKRKRPARVIEEGADKFAVVVNIAVDQGRAYQLLPADQNRRSALIMCFTNPLVMGDVGSVSNALGQTITGAVNFPGCFVIPPSSLTGTIFAFEYTAKQGLYVCCATPGVLSQVQCFIERIESGVPIT